MSSSLRGLSGVSAKRTGWLGVWPSVAMTEPVSMAIWAKRGVAVVGAVDEVEPPSM